MNQFQKFIAALEGMNIGHDASTLTMADRQTIGGVFATVKEFLVERNLIPGEQIASIEAFDTPVRSLNQSMSLADLGEAAIIDLVQRCGINDRHARAACESVALCIENYSNGYTVAKHFQKSSPSTVHGEVSVCGFDTLMSQRGVDSLITSPEAAIEAFGADLATTISDAKVAITVSILRYHRGALHRLIPNIPTDTSMVTYKVDNMEVYDLNKSRANSAAERYEDKHRVPFVDLYNDPTPADTTLKPIVLRVENDGTGAAAKLLAANIVKIGIGLNMFDYSIDAGQIGYSHVDFTDTVADNVRIKTLYVDVTDGTITERIALNVLDHSGSRMLMNANNQDSADRVCSMNDVTAWTAATTKADGTASALLAAFTQDAVIRLKYNVAGSINLRTSEITVHGSLVPVLTTVSGNPVVAADQTLFDSLQIKMVGYEPAAQFSEENVRKTTKAMRILTKEVGYEIPGSSNYVVQYSLIQSRPEVVVDGLTKLMALGNDNRGVKLLLDTVANVHDRINAEKVLTGDNYVNKVGQAFVAGQRVKPSIFMGTLQIPAELKNLRSADKWGDIRALAEEYLLNVLSRLYRESYYTQELLAGEKPVFSVLTSIPIKDSLLSVPHYHSHLADSAADAVADGVVEFRRTLPDGTILNVITTTFQYMDDKILMVPVRPNRPQSVLNFAQNRERGSFISAATPTVDNAIFNSLIANSREIPIPTNPVGALITISGLHEIFDGFGAL